MVAVCYFGSVICPVWTTHKVPLMECIFPANGVMIRSDVTETLQFYIFGDLAGNAYLHPFWDSCWGIIGEWVV